MTRNKEIKVGPYELDIRPGVAVGPLALGMSLHTVLDRLRSWSITFPRMEIVHHPDDPTSYPVVVELEPNGLRLQFDGALQRLCLIEIRDMSKSRFVYKGTDLGKQSVLSFRQIYSKIFGPTYPGVYLEETSSYVLSYPGIAFSFYIADTENVPKSNDGFVKYLSGNDSPVCTAAAVFKGSSWEEAKDHVFSGDIAPPCRPATEVEWVDVNAERRSCTIHFRNHVSGLESFELDLGISTMQDVLMALGPPDERVFKQDSRLSIHNPQEQEHGTNSDLFLNYFQFGIDVCLDTTILGAPVKKLVLHGNIPGTLQFQKYERCRWRIGSLGVTSEMKFNAKLSKIETKAPMLFNRRTLESPTSSIELVPVDDDIAEAAFNADDMGITQLYGTQGLVYEVLQNSVVSSLTVYIQTPLSKCTT